MDPYHCLGIYKCHAHQHHMGLLCGRGRGESFHSLLCGPAMLRRLHGLGTKYMIRFRFNLHRNSSMQLHHVTS